MTPSSAQWVGKREGGSRGTRTDTRPPSRGGGCVELLVFFSFGCCDAVLTLFPRPALREKPPQRKSSLVFNVQWQWVIMAYEEEQGNQATPHTVRAWPSNTTHSAGMGPVEYRGFVWGIDGTIKKEGKVWATRNARRHTHGLHIFFGI